LFIIYYIYFYCFILAILIEAKKENIKKENIKKSNKNAIENLFLK